MPTLTGTGLVQAVRDYIDQPANGDPTRAFITDDMVYRWLSQGYREMLRTVGQRGVIFSVTRLESSAPGASISVGTGVTAVLAVYRYDGTRRYQLPRVTGIVGPGLTGSVAQYWRPNLSSAGLLTIDLYPGETAQRIETYYLADPANITDASTVYLPANWDEVITLRAAIRGTGRDKERNEILEGLYQEAKLEAEAATAALTDTVVLNTDHVYPPGMDQGWQNDLLHSSDFSYWWAP